jgi:magnesium-dependent phosphatase 1
MYVFDLDGCVWDPEMYQLWGGGAPFAPDAKNEGDLLDCKGQMVSLMADVRRIWRMLHEDPAYAGARVAVASCCDEPAWADECLSKFTVAPGVALADIVSFSEIHKGSKAGHLASISRASGVALEDMIFFDNEPGNCRTVQGVGVTSVYTPGGVTMSEFEKGLAEFPSASVVSVR